MFLPSEDEGDDAPTPKKPRKERARSLTPEVVAVEPTPAHRRKGRATALVAEADKVPQSVAKHGYPEHAYLLGWLIYSGHEVLKRPAKCGRCLRYGHTCSGEAGKMCGRCMRDRQGCVVAEEYVAKDEKDSREPEVKERGLKGKSKGKAKDKGLTTGSSSISSKGVLGKFVMPFLRASLADSQIPPKAPNVYAGRRGEDGGAGGEVGGSDEECVQKVERFKWRGVGTQGGPGDDKEVSEIE
ncbi:hypothetical protein JB92DRAFT_3106348 [Gautieria morchelliformis]|nr:hypothetical protein JB92DRAFT_3106348 [Gautieria morchelliformis]